MPESSERVRVLVAEDDWLIRLLTADVLQEDCGLEVLQADDGLTALALLEEPDNVALVVTDLRMPGANGLTLARKARAAHPGIPLLFVTGTPELLNGQSDLKPFECLAKPYDPCAMVRTVNYLLSGLGHV